MRQKPNPLLVQIMICRLFGPKLLYEPILEYCLIYHWEQTSVKSYTKFMHFHSRKNIRNVVWKMAAILSRPQCVKLIGLHLKRKKYGPHDDVMKSKHFPRYWPFVRGIPRSSVNSPHKGQWRGALMFSLICARINGWVNDREAGDLRRYRAHYDVTVINSLLWIPFIYIVNDENCRACKSEADSNTIHNIIKHNNIWHISCWNKGKISYDNCS